MKQFEFQTDSIGCMENTVKKITVLAMAPDKIDANTGAMLFCHGWGPNRFQMIDRLKATADKYNLFCISPEYRMSGYDYDPVGGSGWYRPYDMSFYQIFDVLLSLRFLLEMHRELNRKRVFLYGQSQGGHLGLLSSIYAPNTFAAVYVSSAVTCIVDDPYHVKCYGRTFSDAERRIRNVHAMIDRITTPIFLEHGTADESVDWKTHSQAVETELKALGKPCHAVYYEGGNHALTPTTTKLEAFKAMVPLFIDSYENNRIDDFTAGTKITIPCGEKTMYVDWSRDVLDPELMKWE